jgi:hypothetical protein
MSETFFLTKKNYYGGTPLGYTTATAPEKARKSIEEIVEYL